MLGLVKVVTSLYHCRVLVAPTVLEDISLDKHGLVPAVVMQCFCLNLVALVVAILSKQQFTVGDAIILGKVSVVTSVNIVIVLIWYVHQTESK